MKKEYFPVTAIVMLCFLFGAFSTGKMLFNNRTPYVLSCDGLLLDTGVVYAISNYEKQSDDTVFIHYEQSRPIMPSTLGYVYFDNTSQQFVLKNHACIFNPAKTATNYFLPFCRTLNDGWFEDGIYYGSNEVISQNILIERGIKYNVPVGTKENRVALEFEKTKKGLLLKTKDDGIKIKYPLQREKDNQFELIFNEPVGNTDYPNIFLFDNTSGAEGTYTLSATPGLNSVAFYVRHEGGLVVAGKGSNPSFIINGFQFSFTPKYGTLFSILLLTYFLFIAGFQFYLIAQIQQAKSPLITSLISFRILLNCVAFLGIPLFLTCYPLYDYRGWYLVLIVVLNLSFFAPKNMLTRINPLSARIAKYGIWAAIAAAPFIFWKGTSNEVFLGIIPVLHCQKIVILTLFFITRNRFFESKHFLRIALILGYSFLISMVTSDIGSVIYIGLAIALIEIIRKTVNIRYVFLSVAGVAFILFSIYKISPDSFVKERKWYRLVAPYTNPGSKALVKANESDRESYSSLILNLKNLQDGKTPAFNDIIVPSNMRSTMHSDFAVHWSLAYGNIIFLILFLATIFLLLSRLLFLLYASIRICTVRQGVSFIFPSTREAELVRFLLSLTIIAFSYPLASNLLLIPLTGQSLPLLSTSNVEVSFLIILVVSLENIFNNPGHYQSSRTNYAYSDMSKSIHWGLLLASAVFLLLFTFRYISLYFTPDTFYWKKHSPEERENLEQQIPDSKDKAALVAFAKEIIGDDPMTTVERSKKPILKNLAALYYSGKPYSEAFPESRTFYNSTRKMLAQMSVDSFFSEKRKVISGPVHPYDTVYSMVQRVNNRIQTNVSHEYYNCIPLDAESINSDLTAECNEALEAHLGEIGIAENIGSVMIVDNRTGGIVANSSFPFDALVNSSEIYYLIGSLKKILVAYCALKIDPAYQLKRYGGRTFEYFISRSDDFYASSLLKDLLAVHSEEFEKVLKSDFDLSLYSLAEDAFLDELPQPNDFVKQLDRNNTIYRQAIGQQRPYPLRDVMEWFVRINTLKAVELNYYNQAKKFADLSLPTPEYDFLKSAMNEVLSGTANNVRMALAQHNISTADFTCKTGTAERADRNGNASSSLIISTSNYTIGIMLKGTIPHNAERLSAKDLFITLIPTLMKYEILNDRQQQLARQAEN